MFNIKNSNDKLPNFNTNKLILKVDKKLLTRTELKPKEIKSNNQTLQPSEPLFNKSMFEIY